MKQKEIQGEYDLVVSLGAPCQVAFQMRRHNLRTFSSPLDWTVLESVPHLIQLLETQFEDFFLLDNLEVQKRHDHTFLVMDTKSQCLSVHDFPLTDGFDQALDAHSVVYAKFQRRAKRLFGYLHLSRRTLFIRFHASEQDTRDLERCLQRLVPHPFSLIVLNESSSTEFRECDWRIPNTYAAYTHQTPNLPWQGYDLHWDIILKNVKLSLQAKNFVQTTNDPV